MKKENKVCEIAKQSKAEPNQSFQIASRLEELEYEGELKLDETPLPPTVDGELKVVEIRNLVLNLRPLLLLFCSLKEVLCCCNLTTVLEGS